MKSNIPRIEKKFHIVEILSDLEKKIVKNVGGGRGTIFENNRSFF